MSIPIREGQSIRNNFNIVIMNILTVITHNNQIWNVIAR